MSNQHISFLQSQDDSDERAVSELDTIPSIPTAPFTNNNGKYTSLFCYNRLIEGGMVLSITLYYLIANPIGVFRLTQLQNPFYSVPFLSLFALLAWYRLPFAVALLPLTFPYYYYPKLVMSNTRFSLVEITLWTCLAIALIQNFVQGRYWPYKLSWAQLHSRFGPFIWPILCFLAAATFSILIAYSRTNAIRAFREEVVSPLLFLCLALLCLRSQQDVTRLLSALFGSGLIIALIGIVQYIQHVTSDPSHVQRITAVYGSGNDIGLLFDYTLPIGLALIFSSMAWKFRLIALILCLPFMLALYKSDSRGSFLLAIPIALIFIFLFALRKRKQLITACILIVVLIGGPIVIFHSQITDYVINGHTSTRSLKSFGGLDRQCLPLRRPLEGLGHGGIVIVNESQHLGLQIFN